MNFVARPVFDVERVIDGYKARGIDTVELGQEDPYMMIATKEMFNVYVEPTQPFPLGYLTDDIAGLHNLMKAEEPLPASVDLERPGNSFRALSEAVA